MLNLALSLSSLLYFLFGVLMVVVVGWFFIMFLFIHLFCVGVNVCHRVYIRVKRQPGGYGAALPPCASLELSSGHLYQWSYSLTHCLFLVLLFLGLIFFGSIWFALVWISV